MDLNDLVEVGPGVKKQAGDCTRAELQAVAELFRVRMIRTCAAADRMASGLPPACDWRNVDGHWCTNDAAFIRTNGDDPDVPRGRCLEHAPAQGIGWWRP